MNKLSDYYKWELLVIRMELLVIRMELLELLANKRG
jgi:hypothetical protein